MMKYLTWFNFDMAVNQLIRLIEPHLKPGCVIYAEPRGGLPLGVVLSHRLGLPLAARGDLGEAEQVLWVDDILDSGQTYDNFTEAMTPTGKEILPVVWITKRPEIKEVTSVNTAFPYEWVVFPWESREQAEKDRVDYEASRDQVPS